MHGSSGFFSRMTFRSRFSYGSHLSTVIACGVGNAGGSFSIMTFRGGGGNRLPGIKIVLDLIGSGGTGGRSRIIIGGGWHVWDDIWRIMIGGAAGVA